VAELELEFKWLGEDWVLLRFGNVISEQVTERVRQAYERVREQAFVQECIPTYTDLAVRISGPALAWDRDDWRALVGAEASFGQAEPNRVIEIPVRFHLLDCDGSDFQYYAQQIGLSVEAVVTQLLATEFKVAMIGFLPGMPYLSGLPENLCLPRREQLATAVPGTFAIGGQQAGFLPNQTPTGWWRLGCTNESIFDLNREPHGLFAVGDQVRLLRVD
jgi:KipI family sensor histidine kinase inhibitor